MEEGLRVFGFNCSFYPAARTRRVRPPRLALRVHRRSGSPLRRPPPHPAQLQRFPAPILPTDRGGSITLSNPRRSCMRPSSWRWSGPEFGQHRVRQKGNLERRKGRTQPQKAFGFNPSNSQRRLIWTALLGGTLLPHPRGTVAPCVT